ncbi:amidohydrolase [Coprinopsis cinerea okayama7|uniref:Amidohydrolase n=1 Tax=Coprinopsis cinerea (strain Okayama-7 / 130 / ATCC MYA-4618 / FGSC 9003) TaxID=240176 RepID=A8N603_COPC7|nr:amidohydrolase [Coprinopsis cinerea okayama7\|eukprot:XP_001830297.1 amidohydrolase [Coprinopsis cinerea okayama7\
MTRAFVALVVFACLATVFCYSQLYDDFSVVLQKHRYKKSKYKPPNAREIVARCQQLQAKTETADVDYWEEFRRRRTTSDRFERGTKPVLIKNGKIWTGRRNGTEVIYADVLLNKGIIKEVGYLDIASLQETFGDDLLVADVQGAWITPGIVDIHSHIGNAPLPLLDGAHDVDSLKNIAAPWLRSLDGLNTHDESYPLSIAGGVTTALVLPGSEAAIGGQAFVVKLRETSERSPSAMLVEPPYHINTSFPNPNLPPRWRYMKHACGETPHEAFKSTRMDTMWAFREAYNTAKRIKEKQDQFCSRVLSKNVNWKELGEFPDPLQWEALVDVLRGRVKLNVHCYEAVDLDAMVRLSNEFKFPIAAFHHASEAYLVPEVLKRAHGKTPAVALFASAARYKREAYRASEFAPRILAQNGITVVMKSDHPLQDSRRLLYEAQQAYYYGLPWNLALASVTTNPAEVMGLSHRIGYVREGFDADIVVWDSHPLALGATPAQVFIDGIPQLEEPQVTRKPHNFQRLPKVPNFDKEAAEVLKYDGLPPLEPKQSSEETTVFTNVKSVFKRTREGITSVLSVEEGDGTGVVVVTGGTMTCIGTHIACDIAAVNSGGIRPPIVDLDGGSIAPGFLTFGSPLGLQNIAAEASTNDGDILDPLVNSLPNIMGGDTAIVRASDGLEFASRDAFLAYRTGVTTAVTAPKSDGFYGGLGVHFSTGARNRLEPGAVLQEVTAMHVSIKHIGKPSVSTQIAALRRLLSGKVEGAAGHYFGKVRDGRLPLVVEAHSADVIATLLILKQQVELDARKSIQMTITGASEAHLLAKELANAGVGVVLSPSRPFPATWEDRRILPGPPLTNKTALTTLLDEGVLVGIGCLSIWEARNLPFDLTWAAIDAGGRMTREEVFAIGSTNLETLLGVKRDPDLVELVATRGGDLLDAHSKVAAMISPRGKAIYLMDTDY